MAKADTTLPIGIELSVRLVIGDGAIDAEVGTVTLDPGDTPEKVVAEFLVKVAEEVMAQSNMAKELIDLGLMTRVEVPADQVPDTAVVTGMTPDLLAMVLANAEDVNQAVTGGAWKPCEPVPYADAERGTPEAVAALTAPSLLLTADELRQVAEAAGPCGGEGCACQPTT